MSETISNIPAAVVAALLSDVLPATLGFAGASTGTTAAATIANILSASGLLYAGDPQFGVKANGVTDDTVAWVAALAAAAATGKWVVAPIGISLISNFTLPTSAGIIGRSVESGAGAIGSQTLGSVLKCTSALSPGIQMSSASQLRSIQVQGSGTQPAINAAAGEATLNDVDLFGTTTGIDFGTAGKGSLVERCRIHDCTVAGVLNPLSTKIIGCEIAGNLDGIRMSNGCGRNTIVANRLVSNSGYGLIADGTGGSVIGGLVSANHFDSSGKANVALRAVNSMAVAGNDLGRAGRNQSGTPGSADDTSFYLKNCSLVSITGNTAWTGQNDGATGYNGPFYAVYDDSGNVACVIAANAMGFHNNAGSSTTGPINVTSTFNLAASLNQTTWT